MFPTIDFLPIFFEGVEKTKRCPDFQGLITELLKIDNGIDRLKLLYERFNEGGHEDLYHFNFIKGFVETNDPEYITYDIDPIFGIIAILLMLVVEDYEPEVGFSVFSEGLDRNTENGFSLDMDSHAIDIKSDCVLVTSFPGNNEKDFDEMFKWDDELRYYHIIGEKFLGLTSTKSCRD